MNDDIKIAVEDVTKQLLELGHTLNPEYWERGPNSYCNNCLRCGRFISFSPATGEKRGTAFYGTCPEKSADPFPKADFTGEHILIADSDETAREIVSSMLISGGYKCTKTASGMEALTVLASETKVALIVSELMMADLDGIGLLERVREKYPDIPVVIATEVHHLGVAVTAFRCGARDYLLKPFDQESLLSAVRRTLENRRLMLKNRDYQKNLESLASTVTA